MRWNLEKWNEWIARNGLEVYDEVPPGYSILNGATHCPRGFHWAHNGKSIFSKERKLVLIKD